MKNFKLKPKIKNFFLEYFEICDFKLWPPSVPIKFKFKYFCTNHKIFAIFIIIFVLIIMAGVVQLKNKESDLRPNLKFTDIKFIYVDKNFNKFENGGDINLEELARIEFEGSIENIGDSDLLVSLKRIVLKSSIEQVVVDKLPDRESNNFPLYKGDKSSFGLSGIDSNDFLNALKNNDLFYISFEPQIEYFLEDKPNKKYYLGTIMKCGNLYRGSELPKFKPNCSIEKIMK